MHLEIVLSLKIDNPIIIQGTDLIQKNYTFFILNATGGRSQTTTQLLNSFVNLQEAISLVTSPGPPCPLRVYQNKAETLQCTYPLTWWGTTLRASSSLSRVSQSVKKSDLLF